MRIPYSLLLAFLLLASCVQIPPTPIPSSPHEQAKLVVVDIDGTLTPAVMAFKEVRPDAAKALQAYVNKGYAVAYITARSPLAQGGLPSWLKDNHFPQGWLHVAQTSQERSSPDTFKASILKEYQANGWNIEYAYGDSTTDFSAYAAANIPKGHVFALKRRGDQACQRGTYQDCLGGWEEHIKYIESVVPDVK